MSSTTPTNHNSLIRALLHWSSTLVRLLWLVGVVELTRGGNVRMPWYHHVANSGQHQCRADFYFYLFIYMYISFSLNKYKSPLVVSCIALAGWWLRNGFRPTRVFSYYTRVHRLVGFIDISWFDFTLYILAYYFIYTYFCLSNFIFDFSILQRRKFNILFCLSHWLFYTHTPHFLFSG